VGGLIRGRAVETEAEHFRVMADVGAPYPCCLATASAHWTTALGLCELGWITWGSPWDRELPANAYVLRSLVSRLERRSTPGPQRRIVLAGILPGYRPAARLPESANSPTTHIGFRCIRR
jgi:hypothetical protein